MVQPFWELDWSVDVINSFSLVILFELLFLSQFNAIILWFYSINVHYVSFKILFIGQLFYQISGSESVIDQYDVW